MSLSKEQAFSITNNAEFNAAAVQVFRHQAAKCVVYGKFIQGLKIDPAKVDRIEQIPFLPVEFFKSHSVVSNADPVEITFSSSGTTGITTSRHHVTDVSWYIESFRRAFQLFYGDITNYTILALLPSYLEREGSSLIYMAEDAMNK